MENEKEASSQAQKHTADSFGLTYYFFKPDLDDHSCSFRIGSFLTEKMNRKRVMEILKEHALSMDSLAEFLSFFRQIPQLEVPRLFERTLLALTRDVFGDQAVLERFPGTLQHRTPEETQSKTNELADTIENFYRLENQMMDAVSRGDCEEALSAFRTQERLIFIPRSADKVIAYHSKLTVLNVLCRKAVEKAGVHPVHIDAISSRISCQITTTRSITMLHTRQILHAAELLRSTSRFVKKSPINADRVISPILQNCLSSVSV